MFLGGNANIINSLIYYVPALIIAFTIHEFSHAFISYKLGDYQVKSDGRLTLNPLKHIDWIGLLILFLLGFGWAKPVQVHPHLYKNPIKDTSLVALAGPLSNFIIAILAILLNLVFKDGFVATLLYYIWFINIAIGLFNLLPIPPLDGSKILGLFMKSDTYNAYLNNKILGYIFLMIIIFTNFMSYILMPIQTFIFNLIY